MGQQQRARETDTVVLGSAYGTARAISTALVARLEITLAERDLQLPSLPEVVLKIRRGLADESVSANEIARLLGADPALAARVLRIANSALFYRGTRPITSLSAAVFQVGRKMIRNVALSFAAQQAFIGYGSRPVRELVGAVWQHSIRTAVLAHMLARARTKLDADEVFLAGLLHEVGKLYLLMHANEFELPASDPAFQSVLDALHARFGRTIVELWDLPSELGVAIGEHEQAPLAASAPPTLTAVLAVCNYLAEHTETALADDEFFGRLPNLGVLAVDRPTFAWLLRAADIDVRLLMGAFGI